jgi:hypothetical protein
MNDTTAQALATALAADYEPFAHSYRAEHDVPEIAAGPTQRLHAEINRIRATPAPSAGRRLQVLTGANGFGKTHLMGRLLHQQQQKILLVYVPQAGSLRRPEELTQEYLVEELFRPTPAGESALQARLGQWYAPILRLAWERAAPTTPGRAESLARLEGSESASAAAQMFQRQKKIDPWVIAHLEQALGAVSGTHADILRGLTLGLTPHATEAKQWLQGRALPADRARALGLPEPPPEVQAVLQTVAELWRGQPLVLCFDQMEVVIAERRTQFAAFCNLLMGWLHTVPNAVFILAVVDDTFEQYEFYQSFRDRIERHRLAPITGEQAYRMIERRLPPDVRNDASLDLESVRNYFANGLVSPRQVLRQCADQLTPWLRNGRAGRFSFGPAARAVQPDPLPPAPTVSLPTLVPLPATPAVVPTAPDTALRQRWQQVFAERSAAPASTLSETGFRRVAHGVQAALDLAVGQAGVPLTIKPLLVHAGYSYPLFWRVTIADNVVRRPVLVALAPTHEKARILQAWLRACQAERAEPVHQVLVLRPTQQMTADVTQKATQNYGLLVNETPNVVEWSLVTPPTRLAALETLAETKTSAADVARLGLLSAHPFLPALLDLLNRPLTPVSVAAPPAPVSAAPGARRRPALAVVVLEKVDTAADQQLVEYWHTQLTQFFADVHLPVDYDGATFAPQFVQLRFRPRQPLSNSELPKWSAGVREQLQLVAPPLLRLREQTLQVELPRRQPKPVRLSKSLGQRHPAAVGHLTALLGVGLNGNPVELDLSDANSAHVLITGVAQSGKANLLRVLLASLAADRELDRVRFVLLDPTGAAFPLVDDSPSIVRLANTPFACRKALRDLRQEVEQRAPAATDAGATIVALDRYHALGLPSEQQGEVDADLAYLTEHGAAAGVHVLVTTLRTQQTHLLAVADFPVHLALHGPALPETRGLKPGANVDCLQPPGDLFWMQGDYPVRVQAPPVEVKELAAYLRTDMAE